MSSNGVMHYANYSIRLILLNRNILNKVNKSIFLRVAKANNTNLNIITFKNRPLVSIHKGYGYSCA